MSFEIYFDKDCDLNLIKNKTIAIIGYGSQGRAQALNLKDSGMNVIIGLRENSSSIELAKEDGFEVFQTSKAAKKANFIMLLAPDENQAEIFDTELKDSLNPGDVLAFSHGFNIAYEEIKIPKDIHAIMIAPKAAGYAVRKHFVKGYGVPMLIASLADSEDEYKLALSYAAAIGGGKVGIMKTTFKSETFTDLFGEQAVLCGGMSELITAAFETLVEAGYAPEMAFFEVQHEVKIIADLIYSGGIYKMRNHISNTAEFGDFVAGKKVINDKSRLAMKELLKNIENKSFAKNFIKEKNLGFKNLKENREETKNGLLNKTGEKLRELMPLMTKND